jgi:hypothetical protein
MLKCRQCVNVENKQTNKQSNPIQSKTGRKGRAGEAAVRIGDGGTSPIRILLREIMAFNKNIKNILIVCERLETLNGCTARGSLSVIVLSRFD